MIYYQLVRKIQSWGLTTLNLALYSALVKLGKRKKVLVVPPDFTRFHSRAGDLTSLIYNYYKQDCTDIPRQIYHKDS